MGYLKCITSVCCLLRLMSCSSASLTTISTFSRTGRWRSGGVQYVGSTSDPDRSQVRDRLRLPHLPESRTSNGNAPAALRPGYHTVPDVVVATLNQSGLTLSLPVPLLRGCTQSHSAESDELRSSSNRSSALQSERRGDCNIPAATTH